MPCTTILILYLIVMCSSKIIMLMIMITIIITVVIMMIIMTVILVATLVFCTSHVCFGFIPLELELERKYCSF